MLSALNSSIFELALAPWIIGAAVLILWIVALFAAKWWISASMRGRAGLVRSLWFDIFMSASSPALNIAIIAGGIALATSIWPMPARWQSAFGVIVTAGLIAALTVFVDQVLRRWMERSAERFPVLGSSYSLVTGALRGVVIALGLMMFLDSVGISMTPILASLGVGSLAIALAMQETVKNILSGFFVIADKPLQVGDFVKLEGGQEGWLAELGWRSSKFRMPADSVVVVPNSKLVDSVVTNYRAPDGGLAISMDLSVVSSTNLEQVEQVTIEVAREVMGTLDEEVAGFEPSVRFHTVTGGQINFNVTLRAAAGGSIERVKHEFIKRVTARYQIEGIKIP